jgi:hypothetical protein
MTLHNAKTHFSDIPMHLSFLEPLLLPTTPMHVFIECVLIGIVCGASFYTVAASGNAAVYLIAFLASDNSTSNCIE